MAPTANGGTPWRAGAAGFAVAGPHASWRARHATWWAVLTGRHRQAVLVGRALPDRRLGRCDELAPATQIVIDLAVAACVARGAGTPQSYADGFRRLEDAHVIEPARAGRLVRAAGFRNVVAHPDETLDMARVHQAAANGPCRPARVPGSARPSGRG
jgi:hypothetical protein